jgi:hypothetical protein
MGLEPGIREKFSQDPRSGGKKSTGSRTWIRHTAYHAQYELITNITPRKYYKSVVPGYLGTVTLVSKV